MSSATINDMGPVHDPSAHEAEVLSTHLVKHAAIHALHQKHKESKVHHFTDAHLNDHISAWKVIKVAEEKVAYGVNYFAKVQIGADKSIHIRVHHNKAPEAQAVWDFYSLHETIKHNEATCIWSLDEPLAYFNA
ncbi:hypothetical protein HDU99_002696 [Rhizoclosmatium hyalinum]|nr:hypothetical protein HDU99_002696 [Rhizoclosmatium hyalinum]